MDGLKRLVLHPFLACVYAVLALLAHNIAQVKISDSFRSLVVTILLAAVMLGLFWLVTRDARRAAVAATLLLVLFFSYGHVYGYLERVPVLGMNLGRHRLLVPLWAALAALLMWWSLRRLRDLPSATQALNLILSLALVFPVIQLLTYGVRVAAAASASPSLPVNIGQLHLPAGQTPPDIYYIVLDAYTRQDVLAGTYDFDNGPFLSELESLGFTVARCSQSNYTQTELSLSSALNLSYLETLVGKLDSSSDDRSPLYPWVKHSTVRSALEGLDYTFVAFDSGFYRTQLTDAGVYLSQASEAIGSVNGFEVMLVKTSAGLLFTDAASFLPRLLVADVEQLDQQRHREVVLYELEKLPELPASIASPKFVFVHILSPHDPYIFSPDGEPVFYPEPLDEAEHIEGYRAQVQFLNARIIPVLQALISRSKTPPVVILHGDHGPGWASESGRVAILNAYYLPGQPSNLVYPTISPVNTFRLVFDTYFGTSLGFIEDLSYFSLYESPYLFREIPISPDCDR